MENRETVRDVIQIFEVKETKSSDFVSVTSKYIHTTNKSSIKLHVSIIIIQNIIIMTPKIESEVSQGHITVVSRNLPCNTNLNV